MSFKVDLSQFNSNMNRLIGGINQADTASRRDASQSGIDGMKQRVHVVTRRLRNSIRIISDTQYQTRFGSDVWYAGIEEFRGGDAHTYMRPEYNRLKTAYPEAFVRQFQRFF